MKLTDLDPYYVASGGENVSNADGSPVPYRDRIGLTFDCPCRKCSTRVCILFQNPPDGGPCCDATQRHWTLSGESFEDMTLTPSIQRLQPDCKWHGFVTKGEVIGV